MAANILLLKYNLFPLSFLAMNKRDYVKGLLAFYELHQVEPLKKAYMDGYLESIDRYKQKADVLRASSRATLIFRNSIRIGVQRYVYNFPQLSVSTVAEKIFDDVHLSEEDKAYLAEAKIDGARFLTREIEEAMESMNEANCIAYGLSREDWLVYIKKQKWEVELPQ